MWVGDLSNFLLPFVLMLCRLGFIIDFLSKATLMGFMAGAAVIVSLQQLKSLLGIANFTSQMSLVPVMSSVIHKRDEVDPKDHPPPLTFSLFAKYLPLREYHGQLFSSYLITPFYVILLFCMSLIYSIMFQCS